VYLLLSMSADLCRPLAFRFADLRTSKLATSCCWGLLDRRWSLALSMRSILRSNSLFNDLVAEAVHIDWNVQL
jgi:hypothetical protein